MLLHHFTVCIYMHVAASWRGAGGWHAVETSALRDTMLREHLAIAAFAASGDAELVHAYLATCVVPRMRQ